MDAETASLNGRNTASILLVEDHDDSRLHMEQMLLCYFDRIDTAKDGEEGLERYREHLAETGHPYDIVFTDIQMPRRNGIDMLSAILKERPSQKAVVFSAHNETEDLLRLIEMGISHFLLKPLKADAFERTVEQAIRMMEEERRASEATQKLLDLNRQLERAKREAEEASRLKSDFLANMSHEIRTPLNAINGFINLLRMDETDETKRQYLDIVKNSSDHLLQIINDILDLSKIEKGKMELEPVVFDPYRDLISVAELFQSKAAEKEIALQIRYNHSMPKHLEGDLHKIRQISYNLLSNAIKFTPENGKVKYIVWYSGGALNLRVKDYGIGIPEEKQKDIFEAFNQADSSVMRRYGGTGLGLSITAKLAGLMGGSIRLVSREGRGSIFHVVLPLPPAKKTAKPEPQPQPFGQRPQLDGRVLIVDDTRSSQMFMQLLLRKYGLQSDVADNGEEAVDAFRNRSYDLILMDENMPVMNGIDAVKNIRKIEKDEKKARSVPVIALTANALKGDRERFLGAGMNDYLSKPVDESRLYTLLSRYLRRSVRQI